MLPLGLLSAKGFLLPFRGVRNIIKNSRVPLIKRVRKICHLQGAVIPEEFSRGSVVTKQEKRPIPERSAPATREKDYLLNKRSF